LRALAGAPALLTPLAIAAALVGLVLPSQRVSAHSDLLLALLVLATALGISAADLRRLRSHAGEVLALSVAPLIVLGAVSWLLGRAFAPATRDGLLAVGLSSSEVAAVGLVALARADATIALGAVTGSLILAALVGPVAIGALSGGAAHAGSLHLLGRFALVVLVPLALGVAARSARSWRARLQALDAQREGVAALAVVVLVYAALSGTRGAGHLGTAILASGAFLAVSALLGAAWHRSREGSASAVPGALAIAMRDFAVAAALATQAFGTGAAAVPGVYGVMMLVAGAVAAGRLKPA